MTTLIFASCKSRQTKIVEEFKKLPDAKARYERIIEMGRSLPAAEPGLRQPKNLVAGCQSEVYLSATLKDDQLYFSVASEALISAGLAALLLAIYDGESPETILACPPHCLAEIGIIASLTPGRANGLASMHVRMKQEALKFLANKH